MFVSLRQQQFIYRLRLWSFLGEIVIGLQVHPKLRCGVKSLGKEPRCLWRYAAFAIHNFIDTLG